MTSYYDQMEQAAMNEERLADHGFKDSCRHCRACTVSAASAVAS